MGESQGGQAVKYQAPQPQSYSAETAALITQLKDRIKRLEEAGDALASWTIPNGNSHVDWRKAKEAKP
jgi:hypothetical protein